MLVYKTKSGSQYEVDLEGKKIRRLFGEVTPTERQGNDGEWKEFETISNIVIGNSVIIGWRLIGDAGSFVLQTTLTSPVTEIIDISTLS